MNVVVMGAGVTVCVQFVVELPNTSTCTVRIVIIKVSTVLYFNSEYIDVGSWTNEKHFHYFDLPSSNDERVSK